MTPAPPSLAELRALAASDEVAAVERAHAQALAALATLPACRPVAAAAFDRLRALAGRTQKFGTQGCLHDGTLEPWPIDASTTDSERAKWGLPPLAALLADPARLTPVSKVALRRPARARRDAIPAADRVRRSAALAACAAPALLPRAPGAVVAAYWPIGSEADPLPLALALAAGGAALCLPVVSGEGLLFRRWRPGAAVEPAGFGAFAPGAAAPVVEPDVVLAPLLACDARGGRLGWGKGYYDRALAALAARRPVCAVGIAFVGQQIAAVPTTRLDRPLDALATDAGFTPWRRGGDQERARQPAGGR